MRNFPLLPFVAGTVIMTVVGYFQRKAAAARRAEFTRFAAARGWNYTPADDRWVGVAAGQPFGRGGSRKARDVLTGPFGGYQAAAFDYQYTTGSGKNRTTYRHSVFVLSLPVALPWVHVRPETAVIDAAARLFGGQDIELESEDFNRQFRVRAADARFAYDFLGPRTMEALLAAGDVTVQVGDRCLVLTTRGRLYLPLVDQRLTTLTRVCEGLPRYVWSDRGLG